MLLIPKCSRPGARTVPSSVPTLCINPVSGLLSLTRCPRCFAFVTRTDFAQELPRIESEVVVVVPGKLNGVFAHALRGDGLGVGLENKQRAGGGGDGIAGASSRLAALIFAHGARAGVAQVNEVIVRDVAVIPFDINAGAGAEVHLHRLWVGGRGGG